MTRSVARQIFMVAVIAFAAGVVGFASPAAAQSPAQAARLMQSEIVRIDADGVARGETAAVQEAHNRIVRAARRVCGVRSTARITLQERQDAIACTAETVERTIASADFRALSAYYAALDERQRFAVNRGAMPETLVAAIDNAVGMP